ncbi:MAG: class I SAM-dependent methyltransferase [Pirellulaceae bacterium]|nr:class I SAM-dependent methyltransferase [Planctomycetales bacterium]
MSRPAGDADDGAKSANQRSAPRCPVCGETRYTYVFSERGHRLLSCHDCELLYIDPYPQQADNQHHVVSEYDYDSLKILDCDRHYQASIMAYRSYWPRLREEIRSATRMLDLGCGTGHLLELACQLPGLRCVGIELNRERAAYARGRAPCEILEVPIEDYEPAERFDVITLMDVFAHIPNVNDFFRAVRRLLKPNGKLIFKVGEMSRSIRKDAMHDWQIPDHLQFLGMKTMGWLAEKHGMTVVRHDRVPYADELFAPALWRLSGRSTLRNFLKRSIVVTPFALPLLASLYRLRHGNTIFSSLIVLTPAGDA